jgi:uncharacterized protein DUF4339
MSWFLERNGVECGPFSFDQMKELAASGRLLRNDAVRYGANRQSAGEVKGLFDKDEKQRPTPPPLPS